jgi:hypothetical protein
VYCRNQGIINKEYEELKNQSKGHNNLELQQRKNIWIEILMLKVQKNVKLEIASESHNNIIGDKVYAKHERIYRY